MVTNKTSECNNTITTSLSNTKIQFDLELPPRSNIAIVPSINIKIDIAPCGKPYGQHTPCVPGLQPVCCQYALIHEKKN